MKLPKLRAEIQAKRRSIEGELKRMYQHARNLEVAATMPDPLKQPGFDSDALHAATLLFWRHLTVEQRKQYLKTRYFFARGSETHDRYLISPYRALRQYSDNPAYWRFFCLHVGVGEACPFEDQMLAKKLLIERDEQRFLMTANPQTLYPEQQALNLLDMEAARFRE